MPLSVVASCYEAQGRGRVNGGGISGSKGGKRVSRCRNFRGAERR